MCRRATASRCSRQSRRRRCGANGARSSSTTPPPWRRVRYEAPPGSRGNLAELEFYAGETKLRGEGFGTAGALAPGGHWKTIFDAKPETWFNSNRLEGQAVGLDLEDQASAARPVISPGGGDWEMPKLVSDVARMQPPQKTDAGPLAPVL